MSQAISTTPKKANFWWGLGVAVEGQLAVGGLSTTPAWNAPPGSCGVRRRTPSASTIRRWDRRRVRRPTWRRRDDRGLARRVLDAGGHARGLFEGDLGRWHEDVPTIIDNIDVPYIWALLGREPLEHFAQGRVCVMGDEAHPTLPFLAQGANMALEDAIVLARLLDMGLLVLERQPNASRRLRGSRLPATRPKRFVARATDFGACGMQHDSLVRTGETAHQIWVADAVEHPAIGLPVPIRHEIGHLRGWAVEERCVGQPMLGRSGQGQGALHGPRRSPEQKGKSWQQPPVREPH